MNGDWCSQKGDEAPGLAASAAESAQVGLHLPIPFEGFEHGVEDRIHRPILRALDSVVHPLSFSPGRYHACLSQICEMPRDLGLALPHYFNQIADAHFAARD